jgi:hypothetical protein
MLLCIPTTGERLIGFFYKYEPLSNRIVKNDPLQNLLLKIAWRKEEKAPRGASAKGCGGKNLPLCGLAEMTCRPCFWRTVACQVVSLAGGQIDGEKMKGVELDKRKKLRCY